MNIIQEYEQFCLQKHIPFKLDDKVNPYNDSTLFCPAGMQQFKPLFQDNTYEGTQANIQSCIRLNDLEEIGDGSHLLYFNMIGFFSFRQYSVEETINFWLEFLQDRLKLHIDYVTIHPDKMNEWKNFYPSNIQIKEDKDCIWSDGEIGGYCTEFYVEGVEIGNIVNPLDNCIDVGFGLERLNMFVNPGINKTKNEILKETILKIIESGYHPAPKKQGYVLRKLLRQLFLSGESIDHPFYKDEIDRQDKIIIKYERLKDRYKNKSYEWWLGTHGIDLNLLNISHDNSALL